jgi:hypothetical protein
VTRELDADSGKDTSRLLGSGAREAWWLRVTCEALRDGAAGLLAHVPCGWASVCESNSLSRIVEPGLFLQVRLAGERTVKPSARAVARLVDRVVVSEGSGFDLPLDRISLLDGEWALQREASAVAIADGPLSSALLASLRAQFTRVEVVDRARRDPNDRGAPEALAAALAGPAGDWCLVVWGGSGPVPAGLVNALFRRREGVDAVVARAPAPSSAVRLVLVRHSLLPGIVSALDGAASPLVALGSVRELRLAPERPIGHRERS